METNIKTIAEVIMLPTEDETHIHKGKTTNELFYASNLVTGHKSWEHQHLYITTDEEIKEGDWYIEKTGLGWYKPSKMMKQYLEVKEFIIRCRKIIATNDKELHKYDILDTGENIPGIAQIPQSFIKEYCNKGGIDKVMVEYEFAKLELMEYIFEPKLTPNNEIIIHPIKDSWNREEVSAKCIAFADLCLHKGILREEVRGEFTNWIKENL